LHQGVWEVVVVKESVTEPMDKGWEKSGINVPTPGTIASYRKGQYHAHEKPAEWRVHLDRYDPKVHPLLHLADDAPLLLMIADTFITLIMDTRRAKNMDTKAILEEQKTVWSLQVIIGISLMLVGLFILAEPLVIFRGIIQLLIPLIIVVLGFLIIKDGMSFWPLNIVSTGSIFLGLGVVAIGAVSFYLPVSVWSIVIFAVLALWGFGSAIISFLRLTKGRAAVPEGFYFRLFLGIFSLILAILPLVSPVGAAKLLTAVLGTIALLLGIALAVNGLRLRKRMRALS
jgi:uncharacterized membrane protein HdeD (DUF308 family)